MTTQNKGEHRRRVNIEHRLAVLTQSLRKLVEDPGTAGAARRLIASIRSSCTLRGMEQAATAARLAVEADADQLPSRMEALIHVLRDELQGIPAEAATVLVVTTDPKLAAETAAALTAPARRIEVVGSAGDALSRLAAGPVAALVVDTVLKGEDGRDLLMALRSLPAFAALPIVALFPRLSAKAAAFPLALGPDLSLQKPPDLRTIADFLQVRLKRGREAVREARRDPLTGLLNRAAFCELFEDTMARRAEPAEPLALALFGIRDFDALAAQGPLVSDDILRQAGLILSGAFRATDSVARWGNSEFIVLLPGEDQFGGARAVEKALAEFNGRQFSTPMGKALPLRICAGLTIVAGRTGIAAVTDKLDRMLFAAFGMPAGDAVLPPLAAESTAHPHPRARVGLCAANASEADLLKSAIEEGAAATVSVLGPAAAVQGVRNRDCDLFIVDAELPADGAAAIMAAAAAVPAQERPPVLMLVSTETDAAKAIDKGAGDYALKPLDPRSATLRLRRLLRPLQGTRPGDRPRILVVDAEVPQLLVIGTTLHQRGCRVFLARGARDAVRRLPDIRPDFLILDLQAPDLQDSGLLATLAARPPRHPITVIPAADWTKPCVVPDSGTVPIKGRLSRPYKPGTLTDELRGTIPLGEGTPAPAGEDGAFQDEVRRIMAAGNA